MAWAGAVGLPRLVPPALPSVFSADKTLSEIEPLINGGRIRVPSAARDEREVASVAGRGLLERTIHPGYRTPAVRGDKWLSGGDDPSHQCDAGDWSGFNTLFLGSQSPSLGWGKLLLT